MTSSVCNMAGPPVISFCSLTFFISILKRTLIFEPVVNDRLKFFFSHDIGIATVFSAWGQKNRHPVKTNWQTSKLSVYSSLSQFIHSFLCFIAYLHFFCSTSLLSFDITKVLTHHIDKPQVSFSIGSLNFKKTSQLFYSRGFLVLQVNGFYFPWHIEGFCVKFLGYYYNFRAQNWGQYQTPETGILI